MDIAATGAGLVADQAADRKTAKYADLRAQYVFQPVSVENPGPFSSSTLDFLRDLGRRISHISYFRGFVPLSKNLGHDSTF